MYALGVALLIAASVAAMATQSGTFVGVHEVPPFACDRIELRSAGDLGPSGSGRAAQGDVFVPGSRACGAGA